MTDVDELVKALAARIAAGELIDAADLPEALRGNPLVQRLLRFARLAEALAPGAEQEPAAPVAPARIGPWRLVRVLGTGGMGDVWLGERNDGTVEHQVAVKRVRDVSPEFARRLQSERRILARLSHPNIARFIDAGLDGDGSPWLALEYVEGIDLNAWCEQQRPSLAQRLQLFLHLCSAVEHAHRLLVIHRDIKPSNVLVEADGRPRLLDFGVAKLLDDPIGELTAAAFTPAYAAPEQLRGGEVSTATDVYALGLLLFRLIAGGLPDTRSDPKLHVVLSRLDQEETRQPSKAAVAHAAVLPYEPARLAGDLDAIVSKAIRARPEDRYGTVVELSADVRRHLASRPVAARAPTRTYLFARWMRRNRVAVGFGSAAALALVAGTAASLWMAQREAAAAQRANAQAERAERVKRFVLSVFNEYDPIARASAEANPRRLVADGIARAEQELAGDPSLQRAVLADLAQLEAAVGDPARAAQRLAALDAEAGAEDELARARLRVGLANALMQAGQLEPADRVLADALPVLLRRLPADDLERLRAEFLVGRIGTNMGRTDAAIEAGTAIQARTAAAFGPTHPESLGQLVAVGIWQTADARFEEGEATLKRAIEQIEKARGDGHATLAFALVQLGNNYRRQQRHAEALPILDRANRLLQQLLPADHALVAGGLLRSADTLRSAQRLDEAQAALDQVARIVRDGSPEQAQLAMFRGQLAGARDLHREAAAHFHDAFLAFRRIAGEKSPMTWGARGEEGRMLLDAQDVAAAAPVVEETFAMRQRHMAPDSLDIVLSEHSMGYLRAAQGRSDEALAFWRRALAGYERVYGPTHARSASLRATIVEHLAVRTDAESRAQARAEVDLLIALRDDVRARALSAYIATRVGDAVRAGEDLTRARASAASPGAGEVSARDRAWLDSGMPIAIDDTRSRP